MHSLRRLAAITLRRRNPLHPTTSNSISTKNGDDEWNDAWETAWLPEDLKAKNRDPWETDVNYPSTNSPEVDSETKAFVEDMNENWDERRKTTNIHQKQDTKGTENGTSLYSLDNIKKDYRLKKQRIHASLWMKEIEKQQEANLGDSGLGAADDIDRLLDSCSEIFDTGNKNWDNPEVSSSCELKSKPDGWETTSKAQDGNIWEMSQREEDILVQEFDRRIAYSKFQIASFIKTHIFSRRRPIDGWKYMIEVLGPNARKGKGSVSRMATLSDTATQPFKEERTKNFKPQNPKYLHYH
ncbi:protein GAMETE CELL DEFECTIVE 1, mitochondrial [Euphorbia lathyris]|uniref:protein GAMETE CELL DEFECTIVE 1, mitochondrial n=1 Tax=Euphorbia lathyris TaxID=212925 RepID=UPI0033135C41